ncbi:MAG: DUF5661 family protein [Nitrososphaeraceae archaeon]
MVSPIIYPSDSPGKVKIVSNASHTIDLEDSKHFTIEEAKRIGEALGVEWSKFDVEQFRMGLDVELEHGLRDLQTNVTHDNEMITGKIALAHLNEYPDYYTRLDKMEKEAKEFHNKKLQQKIVSWYY